MTTFDTVTWLCSVGNHISEHPSLLGTVSNFEANEAHLRVGGPDVHRGQKLRAFAAWLATMHDVSSVTIAAVPGGATLYTHLHATGELADGHTVKVSASLQAEDVRPLVGRVEFTAGHMFPVEVLLTGTPGIADTLAGDDRQIDEGHEWADEFEDVATGVRNPFVEDGVPVSSAAEVWALINDENDDSTGDRPGEDAVADAKAASVTDQQIDAAPSISGMHASVLQGDAGVAALGVLLRDSGACQDEPLNPEHAAELERAIGHPLPDIDAGGAE
jgi:hypothetical protein